MRLDVKDIAYELQLNFAVRRRSDRPRTVDAVRVIVRVVGRRDDARRPVGVQLDGATASQQYLGEVQLESGGRETVSVGRKGNG